MRTEQRTRCLRCGSTEKLERHHVIPKALARKVGSDYWVVFSPDHFKDLDSLEGSPQLIADLGEQYQQTNKNWTALRHYRQPLCLHCHDDVDRERKALFKRIWEARRSQSQDFESCFFRDFDLGNLFIWFAPESLLAKSMVLGPR